MKTMKPQTRSFQLTALFLLLALSGLSIFASRNPEVFLSRRPDSRSSEIATGVMVTATSSASLTHDVFAPGASGPGETALEPAQSGGSFNITKSVVSAGGGASSGGGSSVMGTVGQSATSVTSGGSYTLSGGFWGGGTGGGCPTITIAPPTLPNAQIGQPYNQTLTASGGSGPYTFTIITGALPPSLTLSSGGVISGTSVQSGSFPITVKATDQNGCTGTKDYTLVIGTCPNITLTPGTLPAGTVGAPYNQPITATGGTPSYTFMISGGALPAGLTLSSGGTISGTPTTAGPFRFTVKAKDANNCEGAQGYALTVKPPVAGRIIRVLAASGAPGATVAAPIELASQGDENALGFSLNFDTAILSNPQAALGGGAGGASLNLNNSQAAQGRLGIAIALPSGQAFAAGARQVVVVTFTIAGSTSAASTPITFGDQPIPREVVDIAANTLPTSYVNGAVTISTGFEADVAPRPNGNNNGTVTIADWTQCGRFAAGLDTPNPGSEFQRADCAPKETKGDGRLTIADWVQCGCYAAGLDPVMPAGGPTAPSSSLAANSAHWETGSERQAFNWQLANGAAQARAVRTIIADGTAGAVTLTLNALGDENALGFSLIFNPSQWRYVSAVNGSDAADAVLSVNAVQATSGRLGLAMALPSGRTFAAGARQLMVLNFAPVTSGFAAFPTPALALGFADAPVEREVVAADALTLAAGYTVELAGNAISLLTSVSAASFRDGDLAREQIVAAFGTNLATQTAAAATLPLPDELGGVRIILTDSHGNARPAPLFFVSPTQINYQIPAGTADGVATIMVRGGLSDVAIGNVLITPVSPSLFAADASGAGLPAARLLRVNAAGGLNYEDIARFDATTNRFAPVPINLGPETDQVFLVLYGTGIRGRSSPAAVSCTVGSVTAEVNYAGESPGFIGLDQVNVKLPRSMAGRGEVEVRLTVDGKTANPVRVNFK